MTDLQRVMQEAQAAIDKGYVFVHVKSPWLTTLLDGLGEAQKEIEWWKSEYREQEESIATVASESHILITDHTAMKEALKWYADMVNYTVLPNAQLTAAEKEMGYKARVVLSTLSNKEDTTCTDSTSTEQES